MTTHVRSYVYNNTMDIYLDHFSKQWKMSFKQLQAITNFNN